MMNTTKINKTTKLLIGLHIGFMLICAVFLCLSLSALTASKSAVGTVTFALTDSPTMTMNMNYYVNNTEHTTYLGTTQATGAEIKETTDVLSVKISQESNVTIEATFDNNIVVVPSDFSLSTNNGVGFTLSSNSNGVAVFDSNSIVQAEDYIILDKLMSGIYVQQEVTTQNYSIEIISQVNDTLPGRATLSGTYTNVIEKVETTFSVNDITYGSIIGLEIFEQKDNQIIIPNGTTYKANGNEMTFTDQFGVTIGTITAVPQTNTAQYTYTFSGWSSNSGTITASTNITANFTRTINQYTVTFYNYDGTYLGASTVDYGGTASDAGITPTKPSDDTYEYKFANWVTTKGGDTVDDLTNVTANRNVYANFTASALGYYLLVTGYELNYAIFNMDTGDTISAPFNVPTKIKAGTKIRYEDYDGRYYGVPLIDGVEYDSEFGFGCGYGWRYEFVMPKNDVTITLYEKSGFPEICCVYEDTLITLADGSTKRADEINIGDKIQSYNFDTNEIEIDTITEIIQRTREELITINFKDGTNIKLTNDHPLYTELGWKCYDKDKGEISYSELGLVGEFTIGDKLFSLTKYFDKEVVSIEYEEDKTNGYNTYQFEVEKNKNYFANGVLSSAL